MTQIVAYELTELFTLVADLCDGDDGSHDFRAEISAEYRRLMDIPAVRRFYGRLVDARHKEWVGDVPQGQE